MFLVGPYPISWPALAHRDSLSTGQILFKIVKPIFVVLVFGKTEPPIVNILIIAINELSETNPIGAGNRRSVTMMGSCPSCVVP